MYPNNFLDFFVSFKCCLLLTLFKDFFQVFVFHFFLMVLEIFDKNRLYVITRGILFDFCRVSWSVIRPILLSTLIL